MAKKSTLTAWTEYLALRGFSALTHGFDVDQNLQTARTIGRLFFHSNAGRRARAERNVALSFPDWSAAQVAETAERSMEHMFQIFMVDAFMMSRLITPRTWPEYIDFGDLEPILERLIRGDPMLLITGHCGNWEIMGYALSVIGFPMTALARPLDNPLINRWLLEIRERRGLRVLTKWGATPELEAILSDRGRIGFIADQNAGDGGMFVPFFGRLASAYKSIGLLAMRYNVPIVAGLARRIDGRLKYRLSCIDLILPEEWTAQPDPLFYMTARINRALEKMVRGAPDQYLWIHRRWKSRPRHERLGRPFPPRLRDKIAALPWMTDEELTRIVQLSVDPDHKEVVRV